MKKVLFTSPHIPTEWIRAHGFIPVRTVPDGNEEGAFRLTEGICSYSRGFFNSVQEEDVAAVIVAGVCDQMRRGMDLMESELGTPFYLFHLPTTWMHFNAAAIYEYELKRLGEFLVSLGGVAVSEKKLCDIIEEEQRIRNKISSLFDQLSYREYRARLKSYFKGEFSEVQGNGTVELSGKTKRVALLGGPIPENQFPLIDILESNDVRIVVDGSETGFRSWPGNVDTRLLKENPFQAMCDNWSAGIRSVFQRPNTELYRWIRDEIQQWDVQGILYVRWIWCDLWHGEFERIREWLDIPVVPVDINGTDSEERNRTRVEAFCEAL